MPYLVASHIHTEAREPSHSGGERRCEGMPRTCTVCRSSGRQALDALLVEGKVPLRELGSIHSLSASALQRHKDHHVPAALAQAAEAKALTQADCLVDHVRELQARS